MKAVHQHCGHNHLNGCLSEFDFGYNNRAALGVSDFSRSENLLAGVKGNCSLKKSIGESKMAEKPKPKPKLDEPQQSKRFGETAPQLEADRSTAAFRTTKDAVGRSPVTISN